MPADRDSTISELLRVLWVAKHWDKVRKETLCELLESWRFFKNSRTRKRKLGAASDSSDMLTISPEKCGWPELFLR